MTFPHGNDPTISDVSLGGQDHEPIPDPKNVTPRSPLAIVDIETTGLYPNALIHEVAIWSTRDGPWDTKIVWSEQTIASHRDVHAPWCVLSGNRDGKPAGSPYCPSCGFRGAQKITGYPDDGHTDGMSPKAARESLWSAMNGHAVIAHNGLSFDMPRLQTFMWPYTLRPLAVDSMHMCRLLLREVPECRGFSLDKLSDFLGIEREGQHLAMSGVLQLSKVIKRLQQLIALGLEYERGQK